MLFLLLAGLVILTLGAELLVRGPSPLAILAGLSPLIVGLTVVAFATSAPELSVSVFSSIRGEGNVVGSNIFNVLLDLGLSAALIPLSVSRQFIRVKVPLMIAASGTVFIGRGRATCRASAESQ